ncbi:hypothetical protein WA158_000725 [Blastocystis sp. Blastoise]
MSKRVNIPSKFTCPEAPTDTISALSFSPSSNMFVATTWNNEARIYNLQSNGSTVSSCSGVMLVNNAYPIMDARWSQDGSSVFIASGDGKVKLWNAGANSTTLDVIGTHNDIVSCVRSVNVNGSEFICTGSFDKTIKYWDIRTKTPAVVVQCPNKITAIDYADGLLIACIYNKLFYFQMTNPSVPQEFSNPKLDEYLTCCSISADKELVTIGSASSRSAAYFPKDTSYNFLWKSSKIDKKYYPNSCSAIHNQTNALITAGGDGSIATWNCYGRIPICRIIDTSPPNKYSSGSPKDPVTALSISSQGDFMAYATGYNWAMGDPNKLTSITEKNRINNMKPTIYIQPINKEMVEFDRSKMKKLY